MPTEEERAATFREKLAARASNDKARLAALAGSKARRDALELAWAPVRDWIRERKLER